MKMTKTDTSYKFWDRVSGWSKAETAANSTLVKCVNSKMGTHFMPGDTVLDFGCGTGTITLRIARHTDKVYGVDISGGMLKRAQQNRKDQHADNAVFMKLTALDEMFQDNFFQVVTIFNVLQYIDNRQKIFNQAYSLLQPKGKLIIAVPCFGEMNSFSALLVSFLRFVHIMPKTYFFSSKQIEKEIIDSGFSILESFDLTNLPEKFIVAVKMQ